MKSLATALLSFAVVTSASAAPACSAKDLIAQHLQWLTASPQNVVRVTAVSNQNNRLVSYAEGDVTITGQPFAGTKQVSFLGGTLEQFFSDRRFGMASNGGVAVPTHPFSPNATDKISLSLSTDAAVGLTLKSWNNAVVKLTDVACAAGVLYGFTGNVTGPRSFYVISMSKEVRGAPVRIK
jgi:hypothetical protein